MARTVAEKLGLRAGGAAWCRGRPPGLEAAVPCGGDDTAPDVLVAFVADADEVPDALADALTRYRRGAALWFAYPKRGSGVATDLTRDRGWGPVQAAGLLAVAQVAIDPTWSALRFRFRDEIPRITRRDG